MKAARIDFVPSHAWRWVWGLSVALGAAVVALALYHGHARQARLQALVADTQALEQALRQSRQATAPKSAAQPQEEAARQWLQRMGADVNPAFAAAENLRVPGVRLKRLAFDGHGGSVQLEFALDTLGSSAAVTEQLNAGYERAPWVLNGIVKTGAEQKNSTFALPGSGFHATWSAKRAGL